MTFRLLDAPASDVPEADRTAEAPHPAAVLSLVGHREAEAEVLEALRTGRLHHAWLISGEEGIGKATLAYRIARFLLANPGREQAAAEAAETLDVAAENPVCHQIAAQAHPDLAVIRRVYDVKSKGIRTVITAEDARARLDVFTKTASGGGYRIAIVDSCDELNMHGANALLKTLEEPPEKGLFLLISSQPGRLLPTIRSRCRALKLRPLGADEVTTITRALPAYAAAPGEVHARAAALSLGSVKTALGLIDEKALAFHDRLAGILDALPKIDGNAVDTVAEATAGKAGAEAFDRFCEACLTWLAAKIDVAAPDPAARLALAEAWQRLNTGRAEVDTYNLDRRPFVIATAEALSQCARLMAR